jgi:NitT/TauT family transport system substrate-binding protein
MLHRRRAFDTLRSRVPLGSFTQMAIDIHPAARRSIGAMNRGTFLATTGAAVAVPNIILAQTLDPVRILSVPVESYALVYYARDQGFFTQHGIDAQIQSTFSGATISQAVVAGAVDVGCASIGPMSNAFLRGIPIRIIAGGGTYTSAAPTAALGVSKTSSIMTAKDLNGKTIGTSALQDIQAASVVKWIDVHGGDSRTTKTIEIGLAEAPNAIMAGRIDAYPIVEPILSNVGDQLRFIGYPYDSIGKRMALGLHVADNDWLTKNKALAQRFVAALKDAASWANSSPAGAGLILQKIANVPAASIAKMHHAVFAERVEAGSIQPEIDVLAEYNYIPRKYNVADITWAFA